MFGKIKCIAGTLGAMLVCTAASSAYATPDNKVKPGDLFVEPPTLISLGFEWRIEGDDNRNASVRVLYRKRGETTWKQVRGAR